MSITLTAKPSGATYRYTWNVPVLDGDSVASATVSYADCTVDSYDIDGSDINLVVSGGASGTFGTITATAVTADGETIVETLYVPIRASTNALGNTGRDIVSYALRKVTGIAEQADADQLADGLETLSDMLSAWKLQGADLGIAVPVLENAVLHCEDAYIQAVKANLVLNLSHLYGFEVSPVVAANALSGLQLIKSDRLPSDRAAAEYF